MPYSPHFSLAIVTTIRGYGYNHPFQIVINDNSSLPDPPLEETNFERDILNPNILKPLDFLLLSPKKLEGNPSGEDAIVIKHQPGLINFLIQGRLHIFHDVLYQEDIKNLTKVIPLPFLLKDVVLDLRIILTTLFH